MWYSLPLITPSPRYKTDMKLRVSPCHKGMYTSPPNAAARPYPCRLFHFPRPRSVAAVLRLGSAHVLPRPHMNDPNSSLHTSCRSMAAMTGVLCLPLPQLIRRRPAQTDWQSLRCHLRAQSTRAEYRARRGDRGAGCSCCLRRLGRIVSRFT